MSEKQWTLSEAAAASMHEWEGLVLEAYRCPAGVLTIGYGHTGPDVHDGLVISKEDAVDLFGKDIATFEAGVLQLIQPRSQCAFDAFVSLGFNIGLGALSRSTAIARYRAGDTNGAAEALQWWDKARVNGVLTPLPGLVRRRAGEAAWLLAELQEAEQLPVETPRADIEEVPPAPSRAGGFVSKGGARARVNGGSTADELNRKFLNELKAARKTKAA